MAFTFSEAKSHSISSPATPTETEILSPGATDAVTTQLQLAHHQSTATLDKEAVLRRIPVVINLKLIELKYVSISYLLNYKQTS
ncbi:hypothetical protein LXL04_002384 [Taraxacum kok-saghyz]